MMLMSSIVSRQDCLRNCWLEIRLSCNRKEPGEKPMKFFISILTALTLLHLCSDIANAQTALINGANQTGTILAHTTNSYTFSANTGDAINVRIGTTNFDGELQLFGPDGRLLVTGSGGGSTDSYINNYTATNSGTFTVLVSSWFSGGTGTYALHLAQIPEAFIVPSGDEGGTLTNGADATGTINLGDLDMWTFTANKGDNINLRIGTTNFDGWLQLFGPDGRLLVSGTAEGNTDVYIDNYTATNSGTFTVLVSSWFTVDSGTYALHLAQIPEAFIVPSGDEGGTLTNGADATGTINLGDLDMWSFAANKGDNINLRVGTASFDGWLQLFGPDGKLLVSGTAEGNTDVYIDNYTATNSGTFTVLVSSWFTVDSGTYALHLAQIPEAFIVPSGDEGGTLTNGADATGTINLGDLDMWSFAANKGDNINLRVGTASFDGWLQLFGPDGKLLVSGTADGNTDAYIDNYTATNSGTFTVLVSSWFSQGTGTYVLHLAQIPETFIVPVGDEGGPLTNGANATGTISLGDLDMWTFAGNKGDNINLRVGTMSFDGWLQLFGPDGKLLVSGTADGNTDAYIDNYTATNSGTFTVLVSSWFSQGTGTYVLNLAQMPEPFIVLSGDPGGAMTGSPSYPGTITLGDQDMFSFTACTGDSINLQLNTTNFDGWLQLFGSNGGLLKTSGGSTVSSIAYTATNCGTFTVLVSSWFSGGTGTYGLTVNGLEDTMRVCFPVISGASLTVNGVGGPTNAVFVLYSTTNIATPFGLWTPILTNHFDQFGVFNSTNVYNPALPHEYFRFVVP
jgi:hypothetical protein